MLKGRKRETDIRNNIIIGDPKIVESEITFLGENNILYFETDDISIEKSIICFKGDNSIITIQKNVNPIKIAAMIYSDSVIAIGSDVWMTNRLEINAGESKNVIIGNQVLFGSQCIIRTTDSHMMYSVNTYKRINVGKSIYIGDHVWLATRVMILKGTKIYSGSVIGAGAVVAGKEIFSNTVWAGNPARLLKSGVFFDATGTHALKKNQILETEKASDIVANDYIYQNSNFNISFDYIERALIKRDKPAEKLKFLLRIMSKKEKNRFAKFM